MFRPSPLVSLLNPQYFISCTNHFSTELFTHTTILLLFWNLSGTTRVSRYQKDKTSKGKTNVDLLEQEIVSGSGICLAICKSAPHRRQPRQQPTTQFFTGRMPFLPPTNSVKAHSYSCYVYMQQRYKLRCLL